VVAATTTATGDPVAGCAVANLDSMPRTKSRAVSPHAIARPANTFDARGNRRRKSGRTNIDEPYGHAEPATVTGVTSPPGTARERRH
jgi:hypothetical protein